MECRKYCSKVRKYLLSNQQFLEETCLELGPLEGYSFDVLFPPNLPFTHLSVSVSPDASGNRENDEGPHQIEFLFVNGTEQVYNDTHDELYQNVWSCYTLEEMVNEILRVYKVFLSKNNEIPNPEISNPEISKPEISNPDIPNIL
jgi:hypothetical protein